MEEGIKSFNLRVYGLLFKEDNVLITQECRGGVQMTKFPGGGLEKGEGLADCLTREFQEELAIDIQVKELFYVNDFFQRSAFKKSDQLISFYFKVETNNFNAIQLTDELAVLKKGEQTFRWVKFSELSGVNFTFPVDARVAERLKK